VLKQRNGRGDAARAQALLREAEALFEAVPWPRLNAALGALRFPRPGACLR